MSRKKKLDPIDVELSSEEWFSRINEILKGKGGLLYTLEHLEEEFRETENPLAVWEAILVCRAVKEHIPEWVNAYLEKVAWKLFEKPPRKKGETPGHILAALGMRTSGQGSIFHRYFSMHEREEVVKAVLRKVEEDPHEDLERHYAAVAEEMEKQGKYAPDLETIARWFRALRERLLPKHYKPRPLK
jgi:hypothetical protein